MLLTDVCLSVAYIGPKSRTERPMKTKIGTEVAHVTRDSGTTFEVKRSKINLQGAGHIVAASRTACLFQRQCSSPHTSRPGHINSRLTTDYEHSTMIHGKRNV